MKNKINLRQCVRLISYLYKLHKLRKNQWLTYLKLEDLQVEKLNVLLHHAYCNVNYYRKLFDQTGIRPFDIKTIKDLVKIPITSRRELQALPKKEIIAKDIDLANCVNLRTSGSTGVPLDIFLDSNEIIFRWLFYRRMYFANGAKLRDREIKIITPQHFTAGQWFQKIGILKTKYLSLFDDVENQLKVILAFKPDIIVSYPSILKNLAIHFKEKQIKNIRPRIIFSTAEFLNRQDRKFLESIFQAEIFDYYACNECGIIAWECKEHSGYHIDSENVIVEFIKEDGTEAKPGEEGEIVITSLNSFTMPFIRYKIGDTGIFSSEQCSCGRTLPLVRTIKGRTNDCIILPDNKKVTPFFLTWAMRDISGLMQYQMIQKSKDKVTINIVKNNNFSVKTIPKIKENCKIYLGNNIEVEINIVGEIAKSRSGKFQFIKSELQ